MEVMKDMKNYYFLSIHVLHGKLNDQKKTNAQ